MRNSKRQSSSSSSSSFAFNYDRAFRFFFPMVLFLWFLIFAFGRGQAKEPSVLSNSEQLKNKLRGSDINNNINRNNDVGGNNEMGDNWKITTTTSLPGSNQRRKISDPPNHAIIVAGHAVMKLNKLSTAARDDSAWYLLPYQLNQGFPDIISSHIRRGIKLAKDDANSLLLYSGGQTRKDVGPTSEAASYYYLAQENKWSSSIISRVYLEEYARDSYENLLFSICRFREIVGVYPSKVTVVGFDFKSKRFVDYHRRAIGFPSANFTYSSVKPAHPNFDHAKSANGEKATISAFKKDMYACASSSLSSKREVRNPFKRTVPYELACPEIKSLLSWCGPELYYESKDKDKDKDVLPLLPWRNSTIIVD